MFHNIFSSIEKVLRPYDPDNTHHKESTSFNKLHQGDTEWSTRKVILGCDLENSNQLFNIPQNRIENFAMALNNFKPNPLRNSIKRWCHLLRSLRRMITTDTSAKGMFTWIQHTLKQYQGNIKHLSTHLHNELNTWRQLLTGLGKQTTQL